MAQLIDKARSLRKLGYASMNINWRNWYLMSAMELEGGLDGEVIRQRSLEMRKVFLSPDIAASPRRPSCRAG